MMLDVWRILALGPIAILAYLEFGREER